MFLELIACCEAQLKLFLVEATKERFDRIDASQAEQTALLNQILTLLTRRSAVTGTITAEFGGHIAEGEHVKMKVPMNATGTLTVAYKNASGGVGRTDGPPTWSASPDGMVTLSPAADGLSCVVVTLPVDPGVPVNSCIVTVDADGDLGEGTVDIVNTALLDIFDPAAGAVLGEITIGTFTPNP